MAHDIRLATTDAEILTCFEVMHQLRPHLSKDTFVSLIRDMQAGGYQLAFIQEGDKVVANAGFRIATSLYMGKHLYVDDLVSDENTRSAGYGHALIEWLSGLAKAHDCNFIHLDSGVQRVDAHRFYMREGMGISCFHFQKALN